MPTLSNIIIYPVKALSGVELTSVEITQGGTLKNDRRWAMVDRKGRMQNGKNNSLIFSLQASFDLEEGLVSFANEEQQFELSANRLLEEFLSERLKKPIMLKENIEAGFPDDPDAYGPTVVTTSSLETVTSWYPGLTLEEIRARFRINLEIGGAAAFWEDQVFRFGEQPKSISMGEVLIQPTNPCARCAVPMKEPATGEAYDEFYETFIEQRELNKPVWLDVRSFDHWYRLSLNTRIPLQQQGKILNLNDPVEIL